MPLTPKQIDAIVLHHIRPGAMMRAMKIKAALNVGLTVLCRLDGMGWDNAVRDVRQHRGSVVEVLTIEGWRQPLRVWTVEQPEPSFAMQTQLRPQGELI